MRQIEENSTRGRRRGQDRGQQPALSPADIDDRPEPREVVEGHDLVGEPHRALRHCPVEDRRLLSIALHVFEELGAVHRRERGLARTDGVEHLTPRGPVNLSTKQEEERAQVPNEVVTQEVRHLSLLEAPVLALDENSMGSECAHHPP